MNRKERIEKAAIQIMTALRPDDFDDNFSSLQEVALQRAEKLIDLIDKKFPKEVYRLIPYLGDKPPYYSYIQCPDGSQITGFADAVALQKIIDKLNS